MLALLCAHKHDKKIKHNTKTDITTKLILHVKYITINKQVLKILDENFVLFLSHL